MSVHFYAIIILKFRRNYLFCKGFSLITCLHDEMIINKGCGMNLIVSLVF